jgi:hypothetical protein
MARAGPWSIHGDNWEADFGAVVEIQGSPSESDSVTVT